MPTIVPLTNASRRKRFQPAHWLADSTMFSVNSKPEGQKPHRRLADQYIIRKEIAEHRLQLIARFTGVSAIGAADIGAIRLLT
jgi:hypothetical protein